MPYFYEQGCFSKWNRDLICVSECRECYDLVVHLPSKVTEYYTRNREFAFQFMHGFTNANVLEFVEGDFGDNNVSHGSQVQAHKTGSNHSFRLLLQK